MQTAGGEEGTLTTDDGGRESCMVFTNRSVLYVSALECRYISSSYTHQQARQLEEEKAHPQQMINEIKEENLLCDSGINMNNFLFGQ